MSSGLIATPAISVIGDADTGIYFPVNGQSFVCGGVDALRLTSTGVTFPLAVTFGGNQSVTGSFTVSGPTALNGSTTIGDNPADTLTVAATGTFTGNQTFSGTITVPDASFSNAKLANMATTTIKGRVTAGTGVSEDLTGTQATTILVPMVGATQSVAGTKGLAPAPAAADQNKVLAGDGTWRNNLGRAFGAVITTTNVNGSQPTFTNGLNIASLSTLTVTGSQSSCTVTFTNALPNATYAVHANTNGVPGAATVDTAYGTKATTSFILYWGNGGGQPTEISLSGFI